ncbi:hypothetical protein J6590_000893 [Homalodisca vitripennis]|nr:hypothetical protein J6590_000893 [Homalodisca vitripennis]
MTNTVITPHTMLYKTLLAVATLANANPVLLSPLAGYDTFIPDIFPEGYLTDNSEVASAKIAHFAERARLEEVEPSYLFESLPNNLNHYHPHIHKSDVFDIPNHDHFQGYRNYPYYNTLLADPAVPVVAPGGYPIVTPEGYLVDTPEVAAAKLAHFGRLIRAGFQF